MGFSDERVPMSHPVSNDRCSQDTVINGFGKSLLNMCTALNLSILNGMCHGDRNGCYTYISDMGSSVIDYFLMSSDLFAIIYETCSLNVVENIDSHHLPITLLTHLPTENVILTPETSINTTYISKYVWDSEYLQKFQSNLKSTEMRTRFEQAVEMIDTNINQALNLFNDCIRDAALLMKRRIIINGKKKLHTWFDMECKDQRRMVRKCLKIYRRTLSADDRHIFCRTRREYKNLLIRKKKMYNNMMLKKLSESASDQKSFWENMKSTVPKRKYIRNNINIEQWYNHFKALLDKSNEDIIQNDHDEDEMENEMFFNRPISESEVMSALRKLKSGKAAGPDGLPGEMLKYAGACILKFFCQILQCSF